jgi:hypothetical protein
MRLIRTASAMLAVAAILTPLLTGCSSSGKSSSVDGGPLGGASSGDSTLACARVGQAVTFAAESFTNKGHSALILNRIELRDPHGVHLIGAYVVPGTAMLGVTQGWPPKFPTGIPRMWKRRQPVTGFQLAAGKSFNMVLGVKATARPQGSSPGMAIYYHDPAGRYVVNDHLGMIVITRHCPT